MKKIAIFNQKGGVGKTTSCVNIAGCMVKGFDKRVLVIDCDPQCNASAYITALAEDVSDYTITDCINGVSSPSAAITESSFTSKGGGRLDVISADVKMEMLEVDNLSVIKDMLMEIEDEYDYCIFDCPPQRTQISLLALCASNFVFVPINPDTDSISGYGMIIDIINEIKSGNYNASLEIIGIFMNNIKIRDSIDQYFLQECRNKFGELLLDNVVRNTTTIKQARAFGMPICYFRPRHGASKDFLALTGELIERMENENRKVGYNG